MACAILKHDLAIIGYMTLVPLSLAMDTRIRLKAGGRWQHQAAHRQKQEQQQQQQQAPLYVYSCCPPVSLRRR